MSNGTSKGPQKKGPQPRGPQKKASVKVPGQGSGSNRAILVGIGVAGLVLVAAIAGYLVFAGGGSSASADAPQLLKGAGCTVQQVKSEKSNDHSILVATGTSKKWNTDPPTSGPHYAVPAVWGSYTQPVNMAQLVHNLEHGGVYILYGSKVPQSTVDQIRSFYDKHQNATIVAPLPRLGDKIALGAWTTKSAKEPDNGTAYLAKCTTFDDAAYAAFLKAYQGRGPERFPMVSLAPGS